MQENYIVYWANWQEKTTAEVPPLFFYSYLFRTSMKRPSTYREISSGR